MHEIHLDLVARNAIDHAFIDHVEQAFLAAEGAPVLLTGTQAAFCAGLNLKLIGELEPAELEAFLLRADGLFRALWDYPGPLVGCVEGHAIAGGCIILQACDLRISTDRPDVRIGVNELALGACFPPNALHIVQARVPRRYVERVVLGAELFSPQEALSLGLVDRIDADPMAIARAEAERLATHPREVFAHTKHELRTGRVDPDDAELERWRERALPQWVCPELRARVRARLGG